MEDLVKVGNCFDYDFGDEKYSFPVETVVICINGETAILKVIGMTAESVDLTLEYDNVVEFFPDFKDPERNMYSRYLFLDINTMELFDDPYYHFACKNEVDEGAEIDTNEQQSNPDAISDDLPF